MLNPVPKIKIYATVPESIAHMITVFCQISLNLTLIKTIKSINTIQKAILNKGTTPLLVLIIRSKICGNNIKAIKMSTTETTLGVNINNTFANNFVIPNKANITPHKIIEV